MSTSKPTITCAKCGTMLSDKQGTCPRCGAGPDRRLFQQPVGGGIVSMQETLRVKAKDRTGFVKVTSWVRHKISGESKRHAREVLTYDKTDPKFTRKTHHVEETTETGEHKVVHDEDDIFPAKRRPKR